MVETDASGYWSDNAFMLVPGEDITLTFFGYKKVDLDVFKKTAQFVLHGFDVSFRKSELLFSHIEALKLTSQQNGRATRAGIPPLPPPHLEFTGAVSLEPIQARSSKQTFIYLNQ